MDLTFIQDIKLSLWEIFVDWYIRFDFNSIDFMLNEFENKSDIIKKLLSYSYINFTDYNNLIKLFWKD